MMITNKHIKELEKRYIGKKVVLIGKRVVFAEDYGDIGKALTGVITEVSPSGQLKINVDVGGYMYISPEDKFHMITE